MIELVDVASIVKASGEVHARFANQPWWRGQGNEAWDLVPQVHRIRDRGADYETHITRRFQQRAPSRYPDCPVGSEYARWLFLMQHHGLPTRLLDWSESILVSAYFAATGSTTAAQDGAIGAIDPFLMNAINGAKLGSGATEELLQPQHLFAIDLIETAFGVKLHSPPNKEVFALVTEEIDPKMMMQLSAFTIHGTPAPLNEHREADRFLIKLVMPMDAKRQVAQELRRAGIRESTLFPHLFHLAADLKQVVIRRSR